MLFEDPIFLFILILISILFKLSNRIHSLILNKKTNLKYLLSLAGTLSVADTTNFYSNSEIIPTGDIYIAAVSVDLIKVIMSLFLLQFLCILLPLYFNYITNILNSKIKLILNNLSKYFIFILFWLI
jgi:hypothetical protein